MGDHNLYEIYVFVPSVQVAWLRRGEYNHGLWMFGTKLVHACERTVRYSIGWVQNCDLVVGYCYE